jgi:hypothetical protein
MVLFVIKCGNCQNDFDTGLLQLPQITENRVVSKKGQMIISLLFEATFSLNRDIAEKNSY